MLQLHRGLSTIPLYSTDKMELVPICLDSGKLATDSCYRDIRSKDGVSRVEKVWVYPKDKPHSYCNQHISLDYCPQGHGVANEYCKKFAQIGALKLESKALLKITDGQIQKLLRAKSKGLDSDYLRNDYVYLVDKNGAAASFFGMDGKINQGLNVPYEVCRIHTKQSWEDYQKPPATTVPTQPTTIPTQPLPTTVPTQPMPPTTQATVPSIPPTEPSTESTTAPTQPAQPVETTTPSRPAEPEQTIDTETAR
jgi:hypothetical protein